MGRLEPFGKWRKELAEGEGRKAERAGERVSPRGRRPDVRKDYAAPDGAGFVFGLWFCKDVTPTALSQRDKIIQPGVARNELRREIVERKSKP